MDYKPLVDKLKAHGLDLAEDALKLMLPEVFDWLEVEIAKSPNKYDDMLLVAFPVIKKQLLEYVDKIDGQAG